MFLRDIVNPTIIYLKPCDPKQKSKHIIYFDTNKLYAA